MNVLEEINQYIYAQPEPKRGDMQAIHELVLRTVPNCKLWFVDGKNAEGKIVANSNIGYGNYTIKYAGGKTKEFFKVGLSANKAGISVYILGLNDKTHLAKTFGKTIGKASVTGYCIKFKTLVDIDIDVLESAILSGMKTQNE